MPRLPTPTRQDLKELEPLFCIMENAMGFMPNDMLLMGLRPEIANTFTTFVTTLMDPDTSVLDPGLKSLVGYVASSATGCRYCIAHTAHSAKLTGVDIEKIERVWEFEVHPMFSASERAALRLARDASIVPNAVTDEGFNDLKNHYSTEEIIEIVLVISLFGFLNRWNDTLATELEASPLKFAQEHLVKSGWTPGNHLESEDL